MKAQKVLIIGSGIGGLSLACRLAKVGYKVTVIEKNNKPGGRCNIIEHGKVQFDIGPTILMMKELIENFFTDIGEKMGDYLELIRVDPSYQIIFPDGENLLLTQDQSKLQNQMEKIEKGSFQSLQSYIVESKRNYEILVDNLFNKKFNGIFDLLRIKNFYYLLKLKVWKKHYKYMNKYFQNPKLLETFTFQDAYIGLDPHFAPAAMSFLTYSELGKGIWYPKGGIYSLITALKSIADKLNVEFLFNCPVKQIIVNYNMTSGVILENDSTIEGDIIIANADLSYVYNNLLPKNRYSKKLKRLKYSSSALMFFWEVDLKISQLYTHNLFLSSEYKKSFHQIVKEKKLPDDPSFYIHVPSKAFQSSEFKKYETLTVAVPIGHYNEKNPQNWNELVERSRRLIIKRLSLICNTDFEKFIKFEKFITPEDWKNAFNLTNGSISGLAHDFFQLTYFRPKSRHRKYKNLYFVGSSTHPGSGVPSTLISSSLACERIVNDSKLNSRKS